MDEMQGSVFLKECNNNNNNNNNNKTFIISKNALCILVASYLETGHNENSGKREHPKASRELVKAGSIGGTL